MSRREATFRALVAQHQGGVLRVCRSILGDEHLGADAAQETFLRLWRRLGEGRLPTRFGGWLRAVAVSSAVDLLRRRGLRAEPLLLDKGLDEAEVAAAAGPGPPSEAARRELDARLAAALERLPEGQRTVFCLRHAGGLSLAEVAEALDVSLSTVKTQFARACARLKLALAAADPERTRP